MTINDDLITFVMCHDQDIIFNNIYQKKYTGNIKFLFLGDREIDKIKHFSNVIICRNLEFNIEVYKNCLQYCAWYAVLRNNLIGDYNYVRFIDYDIDIIKHDINITSDIKGTISYDWNFYFYEGFGDNEKFKNNIIDITKKTIFELVEEHKSKYNQTNWFSSIDTIMKKQCYFNFMNWFTNIYEAKKLEYYFGMHFERYLTIYCLTNNINYETSSDETKHQQLKSHPYY
jgi:hypothetical protein